MNISEIKISYSRVEAKRNSVKCARDCYTAFINSWDHDLIELQEEFKVMLLNRGNQILGIYSMSKGGISGTLVDPKLIFVVALKCAASNIIIAHNHPSGILSPSTADRLCTKKVKEGGKLLDIQVLDHLIISLEGYYSFNENGWE